MRVNTQKQGEFQSKQKSRILIKMISSDQPLYKTRLTLPLAFGNKVLINSEYEHNIK